MLYQALSEALLGNQQALITPEKSYSGETLLSAAEQLATQLQAAGVKRLGLLMDNCAEWFIADLAALRSRIVLVPIPTFFSPQQQQHLIQDAGLDAVLSAAPLMMLNERQQTCAGVLHFIGPHKVPEIPAGTLKITYTSGTTGTPKGVCLSEATMLPLLNSLVQATQSSASHKHLSLLPLAVLLENLAGLYVPLLSGASVWLQPMHNLGISGSSQLDAQKMLGVLTQLQPHSVILVPALLPVLLYGKQQGLPNSLRFIALGGGKSANLVLEQAKALGLPVYEGYGLSEACSVVSLNTTEASRLGSVGKPLPHIAIRIAPDGEVMIRGELLLGYLGQPDSAPEHDWYGTGDIGHFDADGFLFIEGRKKNTIVTSMGRNLSPEWLESELCALPHIKQAYVYGDELRGVNALIVGTSALNRDELELIRAQINSTLPDYARIAQLCATTEPFTEAAGELTPNGRLRRAQLAQRVNLEN